MNRDLLTVLAIGWILLCMTIHVCLGLRRLITYLREKKNRCRTNKNSDQP